VGSGAAGDPNISGIEPVRQRRRGAALEDAIHSSVFSELAEVGYAAFTIESVAARAKTGKASIYRRWPTKQDLVIDAFCSKFRESRELIDGLLDTDRSTRDILVELANRITALAAESGEVFRAVAGEVTRYPELAEAIEQQVHCPKRDALIEILQRGVERGEVRPDAACALFAEVLPAVLMHQIVLMSRPVTSDLAEQVVDQIVMPLVRA